MPRALALLPLLLLIALPALAQPAPADSRVDWLRKNAIRIRSISPEDRDFSDLQPLRAILKDKQVVLLGEPTHGDGAVFLAKTRLIQFLHEEMGFDVLAFESGLFDCRRAWEALQAGEEPGMAFRQGIFGIWSASQQVVPLIEYLGRRVRTQRPLEIAGFDNQLSATGSRDFLVADLAAYLRRIGSPTPDAPDWLPFAETLQGLAETPELGQLVTPAPADQERFQTRLRDLREEIGRRAGPQPDWDAAFWRQMLESLEGFSRQEWEISDPTKWMSGPLHNLRDEQMGRNLIWLARERYPGRKIIVWAATFHNARNLRRLDPGLGRPDLKEHYKTMVPMGEVAWRALGDRMYSLGFTSSVGQTGTSFRAPQPLLKSSPGSLEDLMERAGLENAIVDFRNPPRGGRWLREPLISRPLGYTEMKGDWGEVLDGMMYIREMTPSTRAGR